MATRGGFKHDVHCQTVPVLTAQACSCQCRQGHVSGIPPLWSAKLSPLGAYQGRCMAREMEGVSGVKAMENESSWSPRKCLPVQEEGKMNQIVPLAGTSAFHRLGAGCRQCDRGLHTTHGKNLLL